MPFILRRLIDRVGIGIDHVSETLKPWIRSGSLDTRPLLQGIGSIFKGREFQDVDDGPLREATGYLRSLIPRDEPS